MSWRDMILEDRRESGGARADLREKIHLRGGYDPETDSSKTPLNVDRVRIVIENPA